MMRAIDRGIAAVAALLLVCAAGAGCKKSVKGEESRWTSANKQADELAALYPGFKAAIEERRAEARKLYEAAQSVGDEEQKISQLNRANRTLDGGFVDSLGKVDEGIKKLRGQLVEAAGAEVEGPERARVDAAVAEVERTLAEVEGALRRGAPDAAGADAVVKKVHIDLDHAQALLAKALPAAAPPPAETAAEPAAPATWSCEYCDHVNEAAAQTCTNCGGARPAPAADK